MHKKLFQLFISTLLLSANILLGGCGESTQINNIEQSTLSDPIKELIDEQKVYSQSPKIEEPSIEINSSRFSYELVNIDVTYDGYNKIIDLSFILTDNETGRQWLYLFARGGTGCTSQIIELTE